MKSALSLAVIALLLSATVGIPVLVYDVHRDLADAHTVVDEAGATLRAGHETVNKFNALADADRKNLLDTSQQTADTARDLRALVARLDRSLVDGTLFHLNHITLPAVDAQIRGNGNALQAAIGKLGVTAAKLGDTADGVTAVTNSLNVRINDPVIDSTLRAFNLAAENLSTTTANMSVVTGTGATTMGRVDHVAAYYEKKLTTPASFFKTFFYTGLDLASKGANIATALK